MDLWGSSPAAITSVLSPCRCYSELHLVFLRATGPCPDGKVRARCQAGNSEWLSHWQVLHWLVHVAGPSPGKPDDANLWYADKMETSLSIPVITWAKIWEGKWQPLTFLGQLTCFLRSIHFSSAPKNNFLPDHKIKEEELRDCRVAALANINVRDHWS